MCSPKSTPLIPNFAKAYKEAGGLEYALRTARCFQLGVWGVGSASAQHKRGQVAKLE